MPSKVRISYFYEDHDGGALTRFYMHKGIVCIRDTRESNYALIEFHENSVNMIASNGSSIKAGNQINNICVTYNYAGTDGAQVLWWGKSGIVQGIVIGL